MILVDTSVWVDHLQRGNSALAEQLKICAVRTHPFVIGELALGSLRQRAAILEAIRGLPTVQVAEHDEVLDFIHTHSLHGIGVGFVDTHLLAAAFLTPGSTLWTLDKRLAAAAGRIGLLAPVLH